MREPSRLPVIAVAISLMLSGCGGTAEAVEEACAAAGAFLVQVDEMFSGPPPATDASADHNREQVRRWLQDLVEAADRVSDGNALADPAQRSLEAADAAFAAESRQERIDRFQEMFDAVAEVTAVCDEREVPVSWSTTTLRPADGSA